VSDESRCPTWVSGLERVGAIQGPPWRAAPRGSAGLSGSARTPPFWLRRFGSVRCRSGVLALGSAGSSGSARSRDHPGAPPHVGQRARAGRRGPETTLARRPTWVSGLERVGARSSLLAAAVRLGTLLVRRAGLGLRGPPPPRRSRPLDGGAHGGRTPSGLPADRWSGTCRIQRPAAHSSRTGELENLG